jgi:non-heme chloroperoxidase
MASISERESTEIEAANASGTTPVVFSHGLWLLPSSWATGRTSSSRPVTRR